jgi:dGTPase
MADKNYDSNWVERREGTSTEWNDFARDRARIIHSAPFRRLQGKTQVLGVGESDFYRTRLTHSLEVAQIGSGISEHLKYKYKDDEEIKWFIPNIYLIEAICLAHDIGHPPYGHKGERSLYKALRDKEGFEGNGQTLRICTKLGDASKKNGLNLTRRTLLGLVKYPGIYSNLLGNQTDKPPKCILDTEKDDLEWILKAFSISDATKFQEITPPSGHTHGQTLHKSFDCSIMELADDIAYAVHDLEDAIALGFLNKQKWNDFVSSSKIADEFYYFNIAEKLFSETHFERKSVISNLVHRFIDAVYIIENVSFEDKLLRLNAVVNDVVKNEIKSLKNMTYSSVIDKYEIQTLEYRGGRIVGKLYEAILENHEVLLPKKYIEKISPGNIIERVVCDYIAGMTDHYAARLYDRIFTTNVSSIFTKL